MTKVLWHSNAPWVPTGYGVQTGLFLPYVARNYDTACSAYFGLEGAPIRWDDVPVFPGLGGEFGDATLVEHARRFFGGLRDGIVVTLMDVWVLDTEKMGLMNVASWVPVDHEPAPPNVVDFFRRSGAIPIAMSRFGQEMLHELDALYVPHAVDTEIYRPLDVDSRGGSFPDGAFVVGMVAANKGRPSRKSFSQALMAFSRFAARHEDVFLYLHTTLDPGHGGGENLGALLRELQIPAERIRVADQYALMHRPYSGEQMAQIFSALDVLLNPSFGEGFGVPIIEAAACGVPAIVTDFTAMREVCGAGWKVKHQPYWSGLASWQAIPDIDEIDAALEDCRSLQDSQRNQLGRDARRHALQYDVRRVADEHLLPVLQECERRFAARADVMPSRLQAVA